MIERYDRYEVVSMLGLVGLIITLFIDIMIDGWWDTDVTVIFEWIFIVAILYGAIYGIYYKKNLSMTDTEERIYEE